MSDQFPGPAPPPGGSAPPPGGPPPRSTPLGAPSAFGAPAPTAPPPGYGLPPVGQPQWAQPVQPRGTNGLAVASFVLALLWLCTLGSILGIVFGFVALSQIKRSNQGGRGLAIAGVVLGIIGIVATIVTAVIIATQADELLHDPEEARDVTLESCAIGADGTAEAVLSISNSSSKTSGYIVNVRFTDEDDHFDVDGVDEVPAGETRTVTVRSDDVVAADQLDCAVTLVNRHVSGGDE